MPGHFRAHRLLVTAAGPAWRWRCTKAWPCQAASDRPLLSITTSNYLPLQGYWLATKPTWTKIARRATQNMRCGLAVTEFNVIPWQSKVTKEEGEKLAAQYNMKFFEAHVWKVWSEVEWNAMFPRSVLVCSCQAWKWEGHMWAGWKVAAEIHSDTGCKYCGLILSPSLQCRQFHDRYSHLEKLRFHEIPMIPQIQPL